MQAPASTQVEALVAKGRLLVMPAPDRMAAPIDAGPESARLLHRAADLLRARGEGDSPLHAEALALAVMAEEKRASKLVDARLASAFAAMVLGDRRIQGAHGSTDRRRLPFLFALLDLRNAIGIDASAFLREATLVVEAQPEQQARLRLELLMHQVRPDDWFSVEQSIACVRALEACPDDPWRLGAARMVMGSLLFRPIHGHLPHLGQMSPEGEEAQKAFLKLLEVMELNASAGAEFQRDAASVRKQLRFMESYGSVRGGVVGYKEEAGSPVWDEVEKLVAEGCREAAADVLEQALSDLRNQRRKDPSYLNFRRAQREMLALRIKARQWDKVEATYSELLKRMASWRDFERYAWEELARVPEWVDCQGEAEEGDQLRRMLLFAAFKAQGKDYPDTEMVLRWLDPFRKGLLQALWKRALEDSCPVPQRILEAMDESGEPGTTFRIKLLESLGRQYEAFWLQVRPGQPLDRAQALLAQKSAENFWNPWQARESMVLLELAYAQASSETPRPLLRMGDLKNSLGRAQAVTEDPERALSSFRIAVRHFQHVVRKGAGREKTASGDRFTPREVKDKLAWSISLACTELEKLGRYEACLEMAFRLPQLPKSPEPPPPPSPMEEAWGRESQGLRRIRRSILIRNALLRAGLDSAEVGKLLAK